MANELQSNINKKLLKKFVPNFLADTVACRTVERQVLVNDFDPSTGDQVAMKRPPQYTPQRTDDGNMTGLDDNPIRVGQVQAEVGQFITVKVEATQVERALQLDQLDELLKPIATDMVISLETELVQRMCNAAALQSGAKGTIINKWSDIANGGALMKEVGVPNGQRFALISNFEEVNLANVQSGLGVQPEVGSAWADATVRERFAGFDRVLASNNTAEYTIGTATAAALSATPNATYTQYKNTYQMALNLSGVTPGTGTFKAGQQIQIAASKLVNMRNQKIVRTGAGDVPITLTVLEDATAAAGVITGLKVSGAAINEAGVLSSFNTVNRALASGDALVLLGTAGSTVRQSLAYHKGFFGLGSVRLPKLDSLDSMIVEEQGFSIRVHKYADGTANKAMYRFDMLPTFACFNPFWGMQLSGTA